MSCLQLCPVVSSTAASGVWHGILESLCLWVWSVTLGSLLLWVWGVAQGTGFTGVPVSVYMGCGTGHWDPGTPVCGVCQGSLAPHPCPWSPWWGSGILDPPSPALGSLPVFPRPSSGSTGHGCSSHQTAKILSSERKRPFVYFCLLHVNSSLFIWVKSQPFSWEKKSPHWAWGPQHQPASGAGTP